MKIFLAAPFTRLFREEGEVDPKFRERLQKIIDVILVKGHNVVSAHVREDWGKRLVDISELPALNMKAIKQCDLVIAYIDYQPSGVYVELGWASAFRKRVVILTEQSMSELSPLIRAMDRITDTTIIKFKCEDELLTKLSTALQAPARKRAT